MALQLDLAVAAAAWLAVHAQDEPEPEPEPRPKVAVHDPFHDGHFAEPGEGHEAWRWAGTTVELVAVIVFAFFAGTLFCAACRKSARLHELRVRLGRGEAVTVFEPSGELHDDHEEEPQRSDDEEDPWAQDTAKLVRPSDLPRLSLSGPVPNPLTEEPEEPATTTVAVTLKQSGPLGISWSKCPSSTQWHGTAARVERIKPGSQAEAQRANGLEVGLRLASVNGDSVREMLFTHAVEMVRQARRPVTLELEQIAAQEPPSPLAESVANAMRVSEQLKTLGDDSCTPLRPLPGIQPAFFVFLSKDALTLVSVMNVLCRQRGAGAADDRRQPRALHQGGG